MEYALNNSSWEAYGQSITSFKKEKNGDHLLLEDIKDEKILVAIVADGISNRPCDWLASELTCNKFFEFFLSFNSAPIKDRIRKSIYFTDAHVNSISDKCQGLASTMSLIVWEYERENFYFVNIGDSRVYKVSKGKINCLTRDDRINRPETFRTSSGVVTKDHWIVTKYIGMQFVEIIVDQGDFNKGDMLLLSSDGFYNARKSSFEKDMIELIGSENLLSDFNKLVSKFEILADDDMTALVIRKR